MTTKRTLVCVWVAVLASAFAARGGETVQAVRVSDPPTVDGRLDDAAWTQAARINDFRVLGRAQAAPLATTAYVCFTDERLYVAFRCSVPGGVSEQALAEEAMADVVEIFLAPRHEADTYAHFRWSVSGAAYSQKIDGRQRNRSWRAPWEHAVALTDDGWTAEASVPLFILGTTSIGETPLGLNVTRSHPAVGPSAAAPVGAKADEADVARAAEGRPVHVTWASLQGRFHDPENFGQLTGLAGLDLSPTCAPMVSRAEAMYYGVGEEEFAYVVELDIVNSGGKAGAATLALEDRPAHGEARTLTRTVEVAPAGTQTLRWTVPTGTLGEREARVRVQGAAYSDWAPVERTEDLKALKLFTDRSYYTTEREARLLCFAGFTAEQARGAGFGLSAEVTNEQDEVVHEADFPTIGRRSVASVPLDDLVVGTYTARVMLRDRDGNTVAESAAELNKHPPGPATSVKFDFDREILLVDDEPFFPIGYMARSRSGFPDWELEMLADGAVNCLVLWGSMAGGGGSNEDQIQNMQDVVARGRRHGIRFFLPMTAFGPRLRYNMDDLDERMQALLDSLPPVIRHFRDVEGVIGYYGLDEPSPSRYKYAEGMLHTLKSIDPYRILYSSNWGDWEPHAYELFDYLGRHGYWMPYINFSPRKLGRRSVPMRSLARRFHKPFPTTPQGFWREPSRVITPHEIRATYFSPLIQGGKGTIIFVFSEQRFHPAEWLAQREVLRQIDQVAPVLLTPSPLQNVQVHEADRAEPAPLPDPPRPEFPEFRPLVKGWGNIELEPIQVLVKNHPDGGEVILVANSHDQTREVVFRMNGLTAATEVVNYFDPQTSYRRVGADAFADRLGGYDVRVYRTTGPTRRAPEESVRMAVTFADVAGPAEPEAVNLLADVAPGFETATLPEAWSVREGTNARIVTDNPAEGRRALAVDANPEGWASVTLQEIPLKAESRYRLSFQYRNAFPAGKEQAEALMLVPGEHGTPPRFTIRPPLVQEAWETFSQEFTTREAVTAQVMFRRRGGEGTFWLDDVRVEYLEDLTEAPNNLLKNGSFEQCTYFGKPDWWIVREATSDIDRPMWVWQYTTPTPGAVHGDQVLRGGFWRQAPPPRGAFRNFQQTVPLDLSRDYVLSLYMRADTEALPVTLFVRESRRSDPEEEGVFTKTVELTTEWKRYTMTAPFGQTSLRGTRDVAVEGRVDSLGNILVDAVQLEVGTEPTEYSEHPYRSPEIGPEYAREPVMEWFRGVFE